MSGPNGHFDLDAKRKERAAAAESAKERYRFTFGGREFSMAPNDEWPANVKRLLAEGDIDVVLDSVLDDPEAFWAVKPTPTMQDVGDLMTAFGEWSGVGDLGESVGSPTPASTPT